MRFISSEWCRVERNDLHSPHLDHSPCHQTFVLKRIKEKGLNQIARQLITAKDTQPNINIAA
jgi:hypothetical protein